MSYSFTKGDMALKVQILGRDPFFNRADLLSSLKASRSLVEPYLPPSPWVPFLDLIAAFDMVERGGRGYGRRRVNPLLMRRVEALREWIEWEVIPLLAQHV